MKTKLSFFKKYKIILLIMTLFLIFKLSLLFTYHDTRWDESVYMGMGKYIYSNGQIGLWEDIRPIVLPLILGLFWKLGLNIIKFTELFSVFIAAFYILFIYLISLKLFNKKIAIISSIIVAITPVFLDFSSYGLTGILSTLFALISLFFFIEKKYFLSGIYAGLSFLTRFPQGIIIFTIGLLILIKYKRISKEIIKFGIGTFIPVSLFFLFSLYKYGNPLHTLINASIHQNNLVYSVVNGSLKSYIYHYFYYLIEGFKNNLLLIFSLIGIFSKNKSNKSILFILSFYFAYFSLIYNKQLRFFIVMLPYFVILCAIGIKKILDYKKMKKYSLIIFTIIIVGIMIFNTGQYIARWQNSDKIDEFYNYFSNNHVFGPVLSINPIPVAHSDILLIPYYENLDVAINTYDSIGQEFSTIIFTSEFYPCFDADCNIKKEILFNNINSTHELIFYLDHYQEYYIFSKNVNS